MRDVPNLLVAGGLLAAIEIVATLWRGHTLFLSTSEQLLYAGAALSALTSCVLAAGLALVAASRRTAGGRLVRIGLSLLAAGTVAALSWSLSDGRRVREAAARVPTVLVLALLAALTSWWLLGRLSTHRERGVRRAGFLLAAAPLAALALGTSVLVLPRSYPAFHLGLFLLAVLAVSAGGVLLPAARSTSGSRRAGLLLVVVMALAPWLLFRLSTHPTAGFAVREKAPWSSRLMAPLATRALARPPAPSPRARPLSSPPLAAGVDLRDRDVLLITVDALRADLLKAYGGTGRTPELDRLADESAVFVRAYTPAPHTSYALASLLTGKFVKPLVELGGALGDPPTLPDRLRRYGYRTAAFYPPAIFFVDGAAFEPLQKRAFGFEYCKEMFASAGARIDQLAEYLAQAEPKKPLFVWVHLFEPHEPYDPPQELVREDSERGRYEAEVVASDRAIAGLVRTFRADRPLATVIVSADHGEEFGDHGGRFHGTSLYEEQVRIPLLWSSPGVVAPRRIDAPVELTDVGTTILSTAGIPRDAHMVGDDLAPLLAGHSAEAPRFAFSSIEQRHMVTDGRLKAICGAGAPYCALFDLTLDPLEQRNLAGVQAAQAASLRTQLDGFLASLSQTEAVRVTEGVGLPDALARAKLGAVVEVPALLALLADARPAVRAEAARVLGERGDESALAPLARMAAHDEAEAARTEAAIAAVALGAREPLAAVVAQLGSAAAARQGDGLALQRRAALALSRQGRPEAISPLLGLARDASASEAERLRAIDALGVLAAPHAEGSVHASEVVEVLTETLASVRLREASASALGSVGGRAARQALVSQLAAERYPPARRAEAQALRHLGDARALLLVQKFLGMESGVPEGVRLLAEAGALTPSARTGALLADAQVRRGAWRCEAGACTPERDARIVLPSRGVRGQSPGRAVRITLWYRGAEPGAVLVVGSMRFALSTREGQVSLERPHTSVAAPLSIEREGPVSLVALAVSPSIPELPPPPPEPWEADASVPAR